MSPDYGADKEGQLNDERGRGIAAEQILNNELFKSAVQAVRDDIWSEFKGAKATDADALSLARMRLDVLEGIYAQLARHMQTGRLAVEQLTRMGKVRERIRKFGYRDR